MAKKLLVRTPKTLDGKSLVYDADKRPVYSESIVELGARKTLESLSASMPKHLRYELEEVDIDESPLGSTNEELKKKLALLEEASETVELKKKIADLEAKLAGKPAEPTAAEKEAAEPNIEAAERQSIRDAAVADIKALNAEKGIDAISKVNDPEVLKAVIDGEQRKTVKEAAEKRLAEIGVNQ